MRRRLDVVLGVVYIGLALGLVAASLAAYKGVFSRDVEVTLQATAVGNALHVGSDVKFLGVPVGKVAAIRPQGGGATIRLAIDSDEASSIPRTSVVRMTPESLFGERYVSIVPVSGEPGAMGSAAAGRTTGTAATRSMAVEGLRSGDRLRQDTSDQALQAEDLFESLMPLLQAVQPAKLNATLGELATALGGQGRATGDAIVQWGSYLAELRPYVPALARDLDLLGRVSHAYADASPALLRGLATLTTTTGTLAEKHEELTTLLKASTSAAGEGATWLEHNSNSLVGLSRESRAVLEVLARYAPLFPCVSASIVQLMPRMDSALGKGTGEPGLHADVQVVPQGSGDGGRGLALRGCPAVKGGR